MTYSTFLQSQLPYDILFPSEESDHLLRDKEQKWKQSTCTKCAPFDVLRDGLKCLVTDS